MRFVPPQRAGRRGFTLIELLVVIAIIAVLVSLTAAAVMKFLAQGPELQVRSEMLNLDTSLKKFKADVGMYPPSQIKLCENTASYGNTPLDQDSIAFLNKMFPRAAIGGSNAATISWGGAGGTSGVFILQGHECLVYFLRGPTGSGFSNAVLGANANLGNKTLGPFYTFADNRLKDRNNASPGTFPQKYMDPYGTQPYAYFSAYNKSNGYNRYGATMALSDCTSLNVQPYFKLAGTPNQYHYPDSYQIICAGADGAFGQGNLWTEATTSSVVAPGKDDMTNFYQGKMGY